MKTASIILAAGSGRRFGSKKQFISIHGKPLIVYTMEKFDRFKKIVVVPDGFVSIVKKIIANYSIKDVKVITGGETRQESSFNGLKYIKNFNFDNVIITDANRPLFRKSILFECIDKLKKYDCVVTVSKAINTTCETINNNYIVRSRKNTYELLMPQFFNYEKIYKAHKRTKIKDATDDSQLLPKTSKVFLKEINFWDGFKLTTPRDYKILKDLL